MSLCLILSRVYDVQGRGSVVLHDAAVLVQIPPLYLSTAIATRVKTDADTEIPCTMPLILQTRLPNGHPNDRKDAVSWFKGSFPPFTLLN